jgi:MerR family mercuric resistance operon transcriptional regulator
MMTGLTIGQVAQTAAVHIETLRYYERRGLLRRPPRSATNYRLYPEEAVRQVRFIKRAQELGFSLREIKELLALRTGRGAGCQNSVRERAIAKMNDIDEKIRTLQAMKRALRPLIEACGERAGDSCPILDSLEAPGISQ